MDTQTRNLYKIWRKQTGRSLKRWLTDEQVAGAKAKYPHWRWQKIADGRPVQIGQQTANLRIKWCAELSENKSLLRDTSRPAISYDDLIDLHVALEKGV